MKYTCLFRGGKKCKTFQFKLNLAGNVLGNFAIFLVSLMDFLCIRAINSKIDVYSKNGTFSVP